MIILRQLQTKYTVVSETLLTLFQLEVHHPGLLGAYVRKNDMSANPQLDLDEVDCDEIIHLHEAHNKVDEKDLEARFYRFGVRPEYLQIQRVLNSR